MADNITLDHLLGVLYETVLDHSRWHEAVNLCGQYMGADDAVLFHIEKKTQQVTAFVTPERTFALENTDTYTQHFAPLDPLAPTMAQSKVDAWVCCHHICDDIVVSQSEFYQDFLLPNGIRYRLGARIDDTPEFMAMLGSVRGIGQASFELANVQAAQRFSGHLQRVLRLQRHTEQLQAKVDLGAMAIDALSLSLWVVNATGGILHLNAEAERLQHDPKNGLIAKTGRLSCPHPTDKQRLAGLLTTATQSPAIGGALRLHGEATRQVFVLPLPATSPLNRDWQIPLALVLVMNNDTKLPTLQLLGALYGLTPAELRVAAALVSGNSLEAYAQQAGVTLNTLYTQVKSMYRKTGTSRQGELLALLNRCPPFQS
jgi:DNA-binding CsgD family transcriptional regulator